MAVSESFSLARVLFCAVSFIFAYFIYRHLITESSHRRLAREKGCKPAKKVPTVDPILGLDILYKNVKAYREHRALEWIDDEWFRRTGANTVILTTLGAAIIVTTEPENLKSILSVNFHGWNINDSRKKQFKDFLGYGIFTTDGDAWHRSRQMLRPSFERSQITDLEIFEKRVVALVKAIPKDGSTVDLQDLFFLLTLDVATEFLFGESVNCLAPPPDSTFDPREFGTAFNYCTNNIGDEDPGVLEVLRKVFLPDPQRRRHCRYIHSTSTTFIQLMSQSFNSWSLFA